MYSKNDRVLHYIFFRKKNVGYDFVKLRGAKHPGAKPPMGKTAGGETSKGRKVRESLDQNLLDSVINIISRKCAVPNTK